jgi:flagella basal body P-ring formation protein FlgA
MISLVSWAEPVGALKPGEERQCVRPREPVPVVDRALLLSDEISFHHHERGPGVRTTYRDRDDGSSEPFRGQIELRPVGILLPGEQVETAARASLRKWLSQRAVRFELEAISFPRDILVPDDQFVMRARPLVVGPDFAASGRMAVWVDVMNGERRLHSSVVHYRVEAWTLRSPSTVRGGVEGAFPTQRLDTRKVSFGKESVGALALNGVPVPGGDSEAGRKLQPPMVVLSGSDDVIPDVIRGHVVHLSLKTGGITLDRTGLALTGGRLGQFVLVRLPGGVAPLTGKVIGKGRVEVAA